MLNVNAPTKLTLHKRSQILEVAFGATCFEFTAEFLRVHSPSAEVKGHGVGQEKLQLDKASVKIIQVQPQGQYAIKIVFDDHHDSGIYTWRYLLELGENQTTLWEDYLEKVANYHENKGKTTIKWVDPS